MCMWMRAWLINIAAHIHILYSYTYIWLSTHMESTQFFYAFAFCLTVNVGASQQIFSQCYAEIQFLSTHRHKYKRFTHIQAAHINFTQRREYLCVCMGLNCSRSNILGVTGLDIYMQNLCFSQQTVLITPLSIAPHTLYHLPYSLYFRLPATITNKVTVILCLQMLHRQFEMWHADNLLQVRAVASMYRHRKIQTHACHTCL